MITFDDVTHFNTFGYIAQRQLFNTDEVDELREEFDAVLAHDFPQFDNSQSVDSIYVCEHAKGLLKTLPIDERIYDIPLKVLGHDFQYEGSGGHWHVGDTPWHGGSGVQHWPLPHIKVSLYLDELKTGAGELRVIPGSHRNYLRHVDPRWGHAPDYLFPLRNRNTHEDFRPWGLHPEEVPHIAIESDPGDVLMFTEDILHASYGSTRMRRQLTINFLAYPRSDAQVHALQERVGQTLRVPTSYLNSDDERRVKMVSRLDEIGFARADEL